MYIEIKSDDPTELHRVFSRAIEKGQQAMLTLERDGDFWSLSVNDSQEPTPDSTS